MKYKARRSRFCATLFLAALTAALFTGCTNKAAQQGFERPPAPVSVTAAIMQDVPTYIDAIGKTVAREVVSIQPQVSGRIIKIHFTDGANVRKGDLLFTIDTRPFEASLRQAQANVSKDLALKKQAEANLARDIAQQKFGDVQAKRYRTLVEQGVVSREQYDQFQSNADSLKATVEADRAAIHSAEESIKVDTAAVDRAKVELGYCFIRSPIDGRAGQRLVDIGNVVNPGGSSGGNTSGTGSTSGTSGSTNSLLVIERVDPIYADFTISQNDLDNVRQQMREGTLKTQVRLPDAEDSVTGQLTFLDNAVDTTTGMIHLRATFNNAHNRLWPGLFVNILLTLSQQSGATVVPEQAIVDGEQGKFVYVVNSENRVQPRPVFTSRTVEGEAVIDKGLRPGETIVTDGQARLSPNARIEPKSNVGDADPPSVARSRSTSTDKP